MWRIWDIHIRVGKPTSWVNSFFIRLQDRIRASEHRHRPACLWALPCFSPCQAPPWPLPLFRWKKRGWASSCDLTSWFWNTRKIWKSLLNVNKACHKAPRSATVSLDSWCPKVTSFLIFLPQRGREWSRVHELRNVSFHKHTFVPLWTII